MKVENLFFYDKSFNQSLSVKPQQGMGIIFNQKIYHEGTTVTSGYKYIMRTDIFYKKI